MATVASRLAEAGLAVPSAPTPVGSYVPAVRAGSLVYTSGQLPLVDGSLVAAGLVGRDLDVELAAEGASRCALNALAAAATVCELDRVARVIKVVGYVASSDGFSAQPAVVNGASEVLAIAFGDAGRHAREAVGVAALPMGAAVEVSVILEIM